MTATRQARTTLAARPATSRTPSAKPTPRIAHCAASLRWVTSPPRRWHREAGARIGRRLLACGRGGRSLIGQARRPRSSAGLGVELALGVIRRVVDLVAKIVDRV